ncbi:MAG: hypothetical protein JNM31_11425 [Flavobacteriales bacterium]|nr:hypothetical protein [Flavobacteriales bacterium]
MRGYSLLFLFAACQAQVLLAQETIYDETRVLYKKEISGGFMAHGYGWGLQFINGTYLNARERRLWGIELVGMKHPKEVKSFNPYYEDARGYFFGKLNSLMLLRPTIGKRVQITDKIRRSGVEVNYFWGVGPSIGMLKPVYLQIGKPGIPYQVIVTERYDPEVHFVDDIYGRASWFNGLGDMSFSIGAFGRFGFNFEHAAPTNSIKAIEVGVTVDAFAKELPIMAEFEGVQNKQFFLAFYAALQFGKKLNR